ncbi:hypothetical protein OEZ86_003301 [Tetradesmus obliquus]|nr:hypothetical protein OEZ86_003301 [Tetradesmus obliquus]
MSRPKRGGKRSGGVAKEDHYKAQKDKALRQLEQAQALLQVTNDHRVLIQERSNVLSDMISLQACVMELLRRHWSWMYELAPEATAAEPASTSQPADSCSSGQQSLLHQH